MIYYLLIEFIEYFDSDKYLFYSSRFIERKKMNKISIGTN